MKISVVIPTYNRKALIARTLPSILEQAYPPGEFEVLVVVDGSTDGTASVLRDIKSPCYLRVLEQPNSGAAAARNAGVNVARGELVLFLDDDIHCDRHLIAAHVGAHQDRKPALVHGRIIVSPEGRPTLATDTSATNTEEFYRSLSVSGIRLPQDAHVLCNSSLPRALFLACGGFDENMPFQRDDCEFGLRLWKMGVYFRYCPTAQVFEISCKPSAVFGLKEAWQCGRGEVLLCKMHPDYRPRSALANLCSGTSSMKLARELCLGLPILADCLLAFSIWVAERFRKVSGIRLVGIRLLGIRRRLSFLRGAISEAGSWRSLKLTFGKQLPVLLFHNIDRLDSTTTYPGLTIPPEQFARQVRWLARNGYAGIRPSDWLSWYRLGTPLPTKPVLLTFDDAYAGVAKYALPALRHFGFGAAVFVVTRQINGTNAWEKEGGGAGTDRLMMKSEIVEWAGQGIEFGAHSLNHRDLTKLNREELTEEVVGSAQELAEVLGAKVTSFAYPYGSYDERVRYVVGDAFDLACTCEEGLNDLGTDLCFVRRTMVHPSDSLVDLACRVRFGWSPVNRLRSLLRLRSRWRAVIEAIGWPISPGL